MSNKKGCRSGRAKARTELAVDPPWRAGSGPDGGLHGVLRTVALIAVVAGAAGSVGLLLSAGRRTPLFLLVLFVGWVLSPFVALGWAHTRSKRWSALTRATLYWVTLALALGSLAVYYWDPVLRPAGSARAALFVIVAPASWLLIAIALSMAAWISRRRSRRVAEQPGT